MPRPASGRRRLSRTPETSASASSGSIASGLDAAEAEDHGFVGRVAPAGEGERAHERDLDRRDPIDRAALGEAGGEGEGRRHRAHGVRRGRADADLEELEDADHRFVPICSQALERPLRRLADARP